MRWIRWLLWRYSAKERCPHCGLLSRKADVYKAGVLGKVCRDCLEGR